MALTLTFFLGSHTNQCYLLGDIHPKIEIIYSPSYHSNVLSSLEHRIKYLKNVGK